MRGGPRVRPRRARESSQRAHPFIIHTISDRRRWNMRYLLAGRDMREFKARVRDHWGIGAFRYRNMGGPVLKASLAALHERPAVVAEWADMFRRYFRNWEENRFDPLSAG